MPAPRRVASFVVVAWAVVCRSPQANAAEPGLDLVWDAPPECPSRAEVVAAAVSPRANLALRAEARVTRTPDWAVELHVSGGRRRIEARTCAELAEATALILALAMEGADGEGLPPETGTAAPPPSRPTPPPHGGGTEAHPDSGTPRARATLARFTVGASGALTTAILPGLGTAGGASLAWTPGRLRVAVDGALHGVQSGMIAGSSSGARFALRNLGAGVCAGFSAGPTSLAPCAGAVLFDVSAHGTGVDASYDAGASWLAVAAGGRASLPLRDAVALVASADALVPLSRPTFVVEGEGTVHRPAALGARAGIGVELTIP